MSPHRNLKDSNMGLSPALDAPSTTGKATRTSKQLKVRKQIVHVERDRLFGAHKTLMITTMR